MSEETSTICKCEFCLEKNADGISVSISTYNRHRKNQQEFLEKDDVKETSISYQQRGIHQQDQHDIFQQEDIRQQNVINQQKPNPDIVDENSDEIFDFEENNESYYDYIIDKGNDDDKNDEEDNGNDDDSENNNKDDEDNMNINDDENDDSDNSENDDEDDDSDDNENDDDNGEDKMQIDDGTNTPNEKIVNGLKLLHLKSLYNFTESAYDDIMKVFTTERMSLYKVKNYLKNITNLVPEFYDMCENSCICYSGDYESFQTCPICESVRLDARGKAKKVMPYLSIKDRLKIQFNDENRAKELLYRHEYITNKKDDDNDLDDIFDGKIYKELIEEDFFNDKRDIAFIASCDGYQIFKQKTDDCWLFLMINNNLEPSLRVKKENLLVPFLIPGPHQPKDFNTFLRPFIDEMKELESNKQFIYLFFLFKKINNIFFIFRRSNML